MSHQFRGKSQRRLRRKAGFSQASTRRNITLYDQHGREWTASVGLKTGKPVGQITPSFHAPWQPDHQYLKVNPDNTSELFIDYDAMLNRRRARRNQYHKDALSAAREQKLAEMPTLGQPYPESIIKVIGNPPKPIEPVVAAMQSNKYVLGFTDAVDPRLERFIVKPRGDNSDLVGQFDFTDKPDQDGSTAAASFADVRARNVAKPITEDEAEEAFGAIDGLEADEQAEENFDISAELEGLDNEDLEQEHDAEALGGKTVSPKKTAKVRKPKARTPREKARRRMQGNRPTLATGAAPVIGD